MIKYALIAMSAKPYHAGHDNLIRTAARENDVVNLYVSTSDRARKGELPINGGVMEVIWQNYIEQSLPGNVKITYGGSPIRNLYEFLGAESESGSEDIYTIYSDPADITNNFPEKSLEKYAEELYSKGKIILEPVHRSSTVDVSGTQMRRWLSAGDEDSFVKHLPTALQSAGPQIFNLLKSNHSVE